MFDFKAYRNEDEMISDIAISKARGGCVNKGIKYIVDNVGQTH